MLSSVRQGYRFAYGTASHMVPLWYNGMAESLTYCATVMALFQLGDRIIVNKIRDFRAIAIIVFVKAIAFILVRRSLYK